MTDDSHNVAASMSVSLAAHVLWGIYPVLTKLLLERFAMPSLVFVTAGQCVAWMVAAILARRHLHRGLFTSPAMLVFALAAAARSTIYVVAVDHTLAIYVQLINLLTPFMVAILGSAVFREKPPPHTYKATSLAALGAALVLVGDPLATRLQLGPDDTLGIGLALLSVMALALWTQTARLNTHGRGEHPLAVMVVQSLGISASSGVASVALGQDWSVWERLPAAGWALFAIIVVFVLVGGNILQITAVSRLRAAFYASLIPLRLVVALAAAALLLNERLESAWQIAGAVAVIVTVTLYVSQRGVASGA